MGKVIYITNVSLDGYIEDAGGNFDFSEPSDAVFAFITDLIRPMDCFLYGRRLYEAMSVWETDPSLAAQSDLNAAFAAVWKDADKVVYSSTLESPSTERTRIERSLDADAVRAMEDAATGDFTIGGADIAAQFFAAGLVDECQLFVSSVILGGGKPALPSGVRVQLELLEERRFENGAVYLRHAVRR